MKKLLLMFTALLFLGQAEAQRKNFRAGLRFGVTTSDLQANSLMIKNAADLKDLRLDIVNANYGVQLGLFAQARIGKRFFIQPEVLFNTASVDYNLTDFSKASPDSKLLRETYNNLDIPIMTGLKFGPLRLQAGPVGHVFINSKSELLEVDGYEQKFAQTTWGYQAGVGLDLWKFVIDIKHEGSFQNAGDHISFFGRDYAFDTRQGKTVIALGYTF